MQNPKLTFFGGVGATTGANFLVEFDGKKILIDCGLLQGVRDADEFNASDFKYNPAGIDFLFVTHAHMDHIGRIPKLVKDGFNGKIISTLQTKEISEPVLYDAYKIMVSRERGGVSRNLYEEKNIREALDLWQTKKYGEIFKISDSVSVCLKDAGHILGSAMVELIFNGVKILFTGDLGNSPSPLLRDTEEIKDVDYIVMDSVYGDRNHESKEERRERFKNIILETINKKGEIIIPAFSIDRNQLILYELNNMIEDGEMPSVPVFLDSPLAEKVTEVYKKSTELFNDKIKKEIASGDDIFNFPKLHIVPTAKESRDIENVSNPKIIIAGSGMSEGGRVLDHEARALPHKENTILLMGYQPVGTLGRELEDGAKEVWVTSPPLPAYRTGRLKAGEGGKNKNKLYSDKSMQDRQKVEVKARIENVHGYSAHKDSEHLLEFIEKATSPGLRLGLSSNEERQGKQTNSTHNIKRVFVCMGEPKSSLFLIQRIRDYLDIDAIYPELDKTYELI